ncbi:hypothetical protein PLICRDRAFT_44374, partial [Plicaturopsis crispa FD-325 SS-3]
MQRETKFCERQQAASQQIQAARKTTRQWSTTDIPNTRFEGKREGKREKERSVFFQSRNTA